LYDLRPKSTTISNLTLIFCAHNSKELDLLKISIYFIFQEIITIRGYVIVNRKYLCLLILFDILLLAALSLTSPTITVGLAIISALVVVFFISPLGYIYFLIIWLPYEGLLLPEEGDIRILRLIIILSILLLAWSKFWLKQEKLTYPPRKIMTPLLAVFIWAGLTIPLAPYPSTSLFILLKLMTFLAIFILVFNLVRSESDLKKILYFSIFASLPIFLITFYQYFILQIGRVPGIFGNPNTLGIYCFLTAAITMLLIKFEFQRQFRKSILWLWFFVSMVALFCSGSRASLLGFTVLILAYLIMTKHYKMIMLISAVLLLIIVYIVRNEALFTDFSKVTRLLSGTTGRTLIWESTMPMIKENLITGVGIGGVPNSLYSYVQSTHPVISYALRQTIERGLIHNGYLQKLAELGIIGLFMVLWANINFIRYLRVNIVKPYNQIIKFCAIIAMALMISRLAHSMFESSLQIGPFSADIGTLVIFTAIIKLIELKSSPPSENKKPEPEAPA